MQDLTPLSHCRAIVARYVGLHYATVSRIANRPVHQG